MGSINTQLEICKICKNDTNLQTKLSKSCINKYFGPEAYPKSSLKSTEVKYRSLSQNSTGFRLQFEQNPAIFPQVASLHSFDKTLSITQMRHAWLQNALKMKRFKLQYFKKWRLAI